MTLRPWLAKWASIAACATGLLAYGAFASGGIEADAAASVIPTLVVLTGIAAVATMRIQEATA